MKKVIFFIIFFLFFNNYSYSETCKIRNNDKVIEVNAPNPNKYIKNFSDSRVDQVLSKRKTINVFRPWNGYQYGSQNYGLSWGASSVTPSTPWGFSIREIFWAYAYPDKGYHGQLGIEKFITKKKWGDAAWREYGKTLNIDYTHPDYLDYITSLVQEMTVGLDGVMFDLWRNDNHSHYGGKSSHIVKEYRYKIAKAVREKMGKDFIILGNINWEKQTDTHEFINGVFLELWKKNKSGYSCGEIKKISEIIQFHDDNLSYPRLVAVNVWKIAKNPSKEREKELTKKIFGKDMDIKKFDKNYWIKNYRNSEENIRFAKLFTAMAMVIPENGYIMYGDNNHDSNQTDHNHEFYEFYKTDLGKAISLRTEILEGLVFKEYEKGIIAYNLTKNNYLIKFRNKEFKVKSYEGIFEKF